MNKPVRPKKHLGQHFLKDQNIARKIADSLTLSGYEHVLEIGPGMGVLTKYLLDKKVKVSVMELDNESVAYLKNNFDPSLLTIISADFLKFELKELFGESDFAIIGNFPYNISTQIVFKTLENRHRIAEFAGMFQKEVAERICEKPGSKRYGILSVLVQAFYKVSYLFSVPPNVFSPPPKVESGVIRLVRKANYTLPCDESLFFSVVKSAFQQRRKTLRNSLKKFNIPDKIKEDTIFGQRPEQLSVLEFISLTQKIEGHAISDHR